VFGIRSIPLSTTATVMVAVLLIAVANRIAQWSGVTYVAAPATHTDQPPRSPEPVESPASRDWREDLISLGVIASGTPETATSSDPVAYVGDILATELLRGYSTMKETDTYSVEAARAFGTTLGTNVLPESLHTPIDPAAIRTDEDVSRDRVLSYRADMREAMSVLISDSPPEFVLFAEYLESGNAERLRAIEASAERYRAASAALQNVIVPKDALEYHVRAVNALEAYANTLDRLVLFSAQPLSSLALLRTYNEAERELLFAFDVLAQYYVRKSSL
jgi:hypothetical protein